jgi:hypothetical protein
MLFELGDDIQGSPRPPGLTHHFQRSTQFRELGRTQVRARRLEGVRDLADPGRIPRLRRCAQDGELRWPRIEGTGYDLAQQIARVVSTQGANLVEPGFVQDRCLRALGGSRRAFAWRQSARQYFVELRRHEELAEIVVRARRQALLAVADEGGVQGTADVRCSHPRSPRCAVHKNT